MNEDLLNLLGNFINYFIFVYLFIGTINTECFSVSDMSLSIVGLFTSLFIHVLSLVTRGLGY